MDSCPSLILAKKFANLNDNFKLSKLQLEELVIWCFNIDIKTIKLLSPVVYQKTTLANIHGFLYDLCIDKIRCECSPTCAFHKSQLTLAVNLIETIIGDPIKTSHLNLLLNDDSEFRFEYEVPEHNAPQKPPTTDAPPAPAPAPPPSTQQSPPPLSKKKFKYSFSNFFRKRIRKMNFCL